MPRVTITIPDKTPQPYRFPLDRRLVSLGRGSENDIPIDCGSVSVKHAEMRRVDGGYELRDLGSTNGIKHDGERSEVIGLRNGMSVTLGDVAFDFLLSDDELDELAEEKVEPVHPPLPPLPQPGDADETADVGTVSKGEDSSFMRPGDASEDEPGVCCSRSRCGMILLFLILAAAAFLTGLAVRYQKDTGKSLIKDVGSPTEAPAKPEAPAKSDDAPAADATPATDEETPATDEEAPATEEESAPTKETTEEDDLFGPE